MPRTAAVASLGRKGKFNHATLEHHQISDPDALLALRVNGADLSLDHGYPARIIVPAINGVHNTNGSNPLTSRGIERATCAP